MFPFLVIMVILAESQQYNNINVLLAEEFYKAFCLNYIF